MDQVGITLEELAKLTEAKLEGDPKRRILGVAGLEEAQEEHASFVAHARYLPLAEKSRAGVIFIAEDQPRKEGRCYLIHQDPSSAFQKALEIFRKTVKDRMSAFEGLHPMSVIHSTASLDSGVSVGPNSVVDAAAKIGEKSRIGPNCCIGPRVQIGENCWIHAGVTIREDSIIGNNVIIQPGAVIGSCGFGYKTDEQGHHHKVDQLGIVVIEDDVEIGANSCIDRARFDKTIIRRGTKIDNLVQVGHNVEIGEHCLICGQVGIAGSTKVGNHVIFAGKVAVNGHITIADQVVVGACSAISKSIQEPGQYGGVPAVPAQEFKRQVAYTRQLGKFYETLKDLKNRIINLEKE